MYQLKVCFTNSLQPLKLKMNSSLMTSSVVFSFHLNQFPLKKSLSFYKRVFYIIHYHLFPHHRDLLGQFQKFMRVAQICISSRQQNTNRTLRITTDKRQIFFSFCIFMRAYVFYLVTEKLLNKLFKNFLNEHLTQIFLNHPELPARKAFFSAASSRICLASLKNRSD